MEFYEGEDGDEDDEGAQREDAADDDDEFIPVTQKAVMKGHERVC